MKLGTLERAGANEDFELGILTWAAMDSHGRAEGKVGAKLGATVTSRPGKPPPREPRKGAKLVAMVA